MAVRDQVRRTQRTLAALDAAHERATSRLDQARARRSGVLAEADLAVAAAQEGLDASVAEMVRGVGVELTAQMLAVEVGEVRRIAKTAQRCAGAGGPEARR